MNDEERRKQAEEMILKLSKYMDLDYGEEDEYGAEEGDDMEGYQQMND